MIEITSYLRAPDGRFTPVAEATTPPPDPRSVEGAIDLAIDGRPILDTGLWDYVDELWAYISDMVLALGSGDEASTYFPDQPVRLAFRRHGRGRVLVTLSMAGETRTASADEAELVAALRAQGSAFFTRMQELVPANSSGYVDALGRLTSG